MMGQADERFLIYSGLLVLCAFTGVFLSLGMALGTFVQVALVIELIYWLAGRRISAGKWRNNSDALQA